MDGFVGTTVQELESALNQMEDSLDYGEKAKLQIVSIEPPTKQELEEAYENLILAGFHISHPVVKVENGIPLTEIVLRKGSPVWALLIPLIPTIMVGGLIAFGIVKIEAITKAIMPILLIGGGLLIGALALLTRPSVTRVAEKYVSR